MIKSQVKLTTSLVSKSTKQNTLVLVEGKQNVESLLKSFRLHPWQKKNLTNLKSSSGFETFETSKGLVGVLSYQENDSKNLGDFSATDFSYFRDKTTLWLSKLDKSKTFSLITHDLSEESLKGFGTGLELYSYNFKKTISIKVSVDKKVKTCIQEGINIGTSVNTARLLVDKPANDLNPKTFKELIENEFKNTSGFNVKVLSKTQLVKDGYGLISAVGQGSEEGPYIVHLSYKPKGASINIGAVGKGITFDSGGLDMKPSRFMRWMKKDMGGAGSLFGLAHWIKTEQPKVNCDFVFAIAENSVSMNAFRPGDVLTAQDGTTVEIDNTDAEGRLALASGYNYLNTLKKDFDYMFNIATLTGAIKAGLGDRVAGLFTNSFDEGSKLMKLSKKTGDPLWMMPLPEWTSKVLPSSFADFSNSGAGYGGALSAAFFLKHFAKPKKSCIWFHLDIYAWTDSGRDTYRSKGATGQSVQVLQEWIKSL